MTLFHNNFYNMKPSWQLHTFVVHTNRGWWGKGATLNDALNNANFKLGDQIVMSIFNHDKPDVEIRMDGHGRMEWKNTDVHLKHQSNLIDTAEWLTDDGLRQMCDDNIDATTVSAETICSMADVLQKWVDHHADKLPRRMAERVDGVYAALMSAIYEMDE